MDRASAATFVAGWCVPVLVQGTALLALAWLVDRCSARRAWSELLMAVWCVALARFFLPPDLASPWSVTESIGATSTELARRASEATTSSALAPAFVLALYMGVAGALFALRARRRARLRARIELVSVPQAWSAALARAAAQLDARATSVARRSLPRIGTLDGLDGPAVFGALRPVLLVPRAWLARAPTRRDEHALLHELAHVARRDAWLDELCGIVRALLWFHPLAWIALRRVHELAELQCDQRVARALGAEVSDYRDTLVLAARTLLAPRGAARAAIAARSAIAASHARELRGFIGGRSAILARIERLERGSTRSRALASTLSATFTVAASACVLPMAARGPSAELLASARDVLAAQRDGTYVSCFQLQAAALVLSADPARRP